MSIAASSATVELFDERLDFLSKEAADIPTFTSPGQDHEDAPAIPINFIQDLEERIGALLNGDGGPILFEIHILRGVRGWGASVMSESENAEVELVVDILDSDTGELLITGSGKSWAKKTKFDASAGSLANLFRTVFMDAFERFLYDPENLLALDEALRENQ